jgi:hypothetical protein
MGLISCVNEPTHKGHALDRIYTSEPVYCSCKVIKSNIHTHHSAVVARSDNNTIIDANKTRKIISFRKRTPEASAKLINSLLSLDWNFILESEKDTQSAFDAFYCQCKLLLDTHYPISTVTVTSRDPPFVTPFIKSLLRQKNKLMRQGHIEKANAIATRIGKAIINHNANQFVGLNDDNGQQIMWRKVKELTGKKRGTVAIHTDSTCLNKHYAAVSTDLY